VKPDDVPNTHRLTNLEVKLLHAVQKLINELPIKINRRPKSKRRLPARA
jgi:hypothetical protein